MRARLEGSITVFLSLILLLIMAIIGTVIEAARVNTAQSMAQIAVNVASDSVLASYDRELFDEYHIFGFDTGYGTKEPNEDRLKEEFLNYMKYSTQADKDLSFLGNDLEIDAFDMYGIKVDDILFDSKAMLTDYEGELFLNEAVEYMKYKAGGEVIRNVLEKLSLYHSSQETTEVMEKKLETEEALGELSEKMMDLMCQVEGTDLDENGIKYTKSGQLKVKDNFAKRIVTQTPSRESVSINHELVFQSLKDKYYNIMDQSDVLINQIKEVITLLDEITDLKKQEESLVSEKEQVEAELTEKRQQEEEKVSKKAGSKSTKESNDDPLKEGSESGLEQLQSQIDSITDQINEIQDRIDGKNEEKTTIIAAINRGKESLQSVQSSTSTKINDALDTIALIDEKREKIKGEVNEYEELLTSKRTDLDTSVYEGLNEDLESMKRYTSDQESDMDELTAATVVKMKDTLQRNRDILSESQQLSNFSVEEDKAILDASMDKLGQIKSLYAEYDVASLRFDYSSLVIDQEAKNPVGHLSDLMQNGILSLVIDNTDELSQNTIEAAGLPSESNSVTSDGADQSYSDLLTECKDNEYNSNITTSFESKEDIQTDSLVTSILNILLLNEYQASHFGNYVTSIEEGDQECDKPATALTYEQEYIASGKLNDGDNLKSVVTKIVFLRTIINFLHVYTDREKTSEAYTTATALVGFTCFAPLISLVKTVILLMWSFEEALVDVAALLDGRSVPFFKTRENFKIAYTDLLTVNREHIKQKAERYDRKEDNRKDFSYQDYLGLLYIMNGTKKNCYRAMDLIQLNLSLRKGNRILLSNYLFGYRVSVEASVPAKFASLGFIEKMLQKKQDSLRIQASKVNAY